MLTRKELSQQQARYVMEHGEFDDSVTKADDFVAVVLTQDWCPQSVSMNVWLNSMIKKGEPKEFNLTIFEFSYDKVDFFDAFRTFKESHFRNQEIPYIRYYKNGRFLEESNYVPSRLFLKKFEKAAEPQQVES